MQLHRKSNQEEQNWKSGITIFADDKITHPENYKKRKIQSK